MSEENSYALAKIITEDQRARISHNFKAAKALLARKRPLDSIAAATANKFPHKTNDVISLKSPRFPLAEVNTNLPPSREKTGRFGF
ncbi:hypothetical protein OIU77_000250 [Salix suchowensis]|uniref:Uncharacterized protein n=1 Tax=Salix suchowensis TaxID=1278906 RepID=A0ABQ9B5K3_9ROSI|nr:hypothetical protein OIU77_000250 [Salix suchowensis]